MNTIIADSKKTI